MFPHRFSQQVARVTAWVTGRGLTLAEVVREAGSGLNVKRPKLSRVLPDPYAMVIVVEYRDRLARSAQGISARRRSR
jgi:putative resolvase